MEGKIYSILRVKGYSWSFGLFFQGFETGNYFRSTGRATIDENHNWHIERNQQRPPWTGIELRTGTGGLKNGELDVF